jgi:HEAT repeat protein
VMTQASENHPLDRAFQALTRYTQGDDAERLTPIEAAVQAVRGNPATRAALEQRLATHLGPSSSDVSRVFVCRQLAAIGSGESVPALASLLADERLSHLARFALERIPGPEADRALRHAIGRTAGTVKVGIIHSVGVRRDHLSVSLLARTLADENLDMTAAAAKALGEIGSPDAARALAAFQGEAPDQLRPIVADASLICAERLVAVGDRDGALRLLEGVAATADAPHIGLAVSRARSRAMRR